MQAINSKWGTGSNIHVAMSFGEQPEQEEDTEIMETG